MPFLSKPLNAVFVHIIAEKVLAKIHLFPNNLASKSP